MGKVSYLSDYKRRRAADAPALIQAFWAAAMSAMTIVAIWLLCVSVFSLVPAP